MLVLERDELTGPEGSYYFSSDVTERAILEQVVVLSRKCRNENPARESPKVSAAVVRAGQILGAAFRGELRPGDHAEYTVLEKKLSGVDLRGATLYTTLEPCTTRGEGKVPCVDRIIERGISKVVIAMIDPHPTVLGVGERLLVDAGISIGRFPDDLAAEIEEINRPFTRLHPVNRFAPRATPSAPVIEIDFGGKPLDAEETFAGLLPTYDSSDATSKPTATTLVTYFGYLKIANNDSGAASIDTIWVELNGNKPEETLEEALEGNPRLDSRSVRVFRLQYSARYRALVTHRDARATLHVKVVGLGEFAAPLPQWMLAPLPRRRD